MRLLLISFGAVFLAFFLLFMTRMWGLGQSYQPYSHPFLDAQKPWQVVMVSDLSDAADLQKINKDVLFWLNLAKSQDDKFLVINPNRKIEVLPETLKEKYHGNKTFLYDLKTLRLFYDKEVLLEEFLETYPNSRFILNILDNAPDVHTSLISIIDKYKAESRILIQGDAEIVLRGIKDIKPLWLFGTTRSDIMRLLSFESVWILPASPFYGDVFISQFKVLNRPAIKVEILEELRRRKKNILLGPLTSEQEVAEAKELRPDGYIYESSDLFNQQLDQHPAQ